MTEDYTLEYVPLDEQNMTIIDPSMYSYTVIINGVAIGGAAWTNSRGPRIPDKNFKTSV